MSAFKDGFVRGLGFGSAVFALCAAAFFVALRIDESGSGMPTDYVRGSTNKPEGLRAEFVRAWDRSDLYLNYDVRISNDSDRVYEHVLVTMHLTLDGEPVNSCSGVYYEAIEPGGSVEETIDCIGVTRKAFEMLEHQVLVTGAKYIIEI